MALHMSGNMVLSVDPAPLPIELGGTGQTTVQNAINALLPSQNGNNGKFLTTDGTNISWATVSGGGGGSVTSVGVSSSGSYSDALTVGSSPITSSGTITITPNLFGISSPGIVPQSGGGTSNFLRADGTWAVPPGNITTSTLTIRTISTNNYTLGALDSNNVLIRVNSSSPATIIIPNDTTYNFDIGTNILVGWNGTGSVSIDYESGVTVDTPETYNIGKRYGKVTLIKTESNHWEIEGNLGPLV